MENPIRSKHYAFNCQAKGNSTHFPILFLHGFMGNCRDFDASISFLADEFYCLSVDLPGHGKTTVIGGEASYAMENIAQGLIDFLEVLGINQCNLVGYSMGGRLALYMGLHFPKYFQKVILESASPGLKSREEQDRRIQKDSNLARAIATEDFSIFLNRWYGQPLFRSIKAHPDFAKMLARRLQNNPLALSQSLLGLGTGVQLSLWKKLPENSMPILLMAGELDQKFVNINTKMSALCRHSKLLIVRGCGHNIHFDNADIFAQSIKEFLLPGGIGSSTIAEGSEASAAKGLED